MNHSVSRKMLFAATNFQLNISSFWCNYNESEEIEEGALLFCFVFVRLNTMTSVCRFNLCGLVTECLWWNHPASVAFWVPLQVRLHEQGDIIPENQRRWATIHQHANLLPFCQITCPSSVALWWEKIYKNRQCTLWAYLTIVRNCNGSFTGT